MYKEVMAKSAMCAVPVGAVSTGGYFIVTYVQSQGEKGITAEASGKSYEEGAMGKIYGKYLLSTGKENEKSWEKIFLGLADSNVSSSVFSVSTTSYAFSEETHVNTALNKQCESQYQKKIKTDNDDSGTIEPGDNEGKAIWLLCSIWNPKGIGESTGYELGSIGKTKSNELLSTSGEDNEQLWKSKNSDFFSLTEAPTEKLFGDLYGQKDQENRGDLRSTCNNAYQVKPGNDGQSSADEVLKYCSMKPIA